MLPEYAPKHLTELERGIRSISAHIQDPIIKQLRPQPYDGYGRDDSTGTFGWIHLPAESAAEAIRAHINILLTSVQWIQHEVENLVRSIVACSEPINWKQFRSLKPRLAGRPRPTVFYTYRSTHDGWGEKPGKPVLLVTPIAPDFEERLACCYQQIPILIARIAHKDRYLHFARAITETFRPGESFDVGRIRSDLSANQTRVFLCRMVSESILVKCKRTNEGRLWAVSEVLREARVSCVS